MSTLNGGPSGIVTRGLVLYLDAANANSYASGSTVWRDMTYFNSSGSLTNGPTFNGANGGSIQFDGVDEYCRNVFSFAKTNVISINLWANFTSITNPLYPTGNPPLFQIQSGLDTPTENASFKIITGWIIDTVGEVWGRIIDSAGTKNLPGLAGVALITANQWNHYCYVADGSNYKLYINSIFKKEVAYNGTILSYDRVFIAAQGPERSNIKIANFQIYNRALSAAEILQNYNSTKTRFGL